MAFNFVFGACQTARNWLARLSIAVCVTASASITMASAGIASERAISLYNIHNRENITIVYKRNGKFIADALQKLNWFLRDWRQERPTRMDPKLFDLLWSMHKELGSQRPIHVISAYRSPKTNEMLRKTRGGQARRSRHTMGMAIDVHFPDVPVHKLRYAALIRQQGGVGYYPRSSIPFVHVDTGRVRHWPRMGRSELALLFPNGRTKHRPPDNKPITRRDAVAARRKSPQLAIRVAAYHDLRNGRTQPSLNWGARTRVAALPRPQRVSPPRPRLVAASLSIPRAIPPRRQVPRLLTAPKLAVGTEPKPSKQLADPTALLSRLAERNNREARQRLANRASADRMRLAALTEKAAGADAQSSLVDPRSRRAGVPPPPKAPKIRDDVAWVPTDEPDHEHPEELTYAPFPVTPYLTDTPSSDDPALLVLTHPDPTKSLMMLAEAGNQPVAIWNTSSSFGSMAAMNKFTGRAVLLAGLLPPPDGRRSKPPPELGPSAPPQVASR